MSRRRPRLDVPEPITRQLRRRRTIRRWIGVALLLLSLTTLLDRVGVFGYRGDDWGNYDRQTVVVTKVIDGDTVRIRRSPEAAEETVRLLGIDAPEISNSPGQPDDHWGRESTNYLTALLAGKSVSVRLDATETRDRYNRLLAYLHVNGSDNVNQMLVDEGHAYAHRMFAHSLRRQFEQAEDAARVKERGLWAELNESDMPAWRQRWLAERHSEPARR